MKLAANPLEERDALHREIRRLEDRLAEAERKNAVLGESEERHRRLLVTLPDAVIIHSGGKIAYVNPAAIRLFRANDHTRLVGRSSVDLVHPDSRALEPRRTRRAAARSPAQPPMEQKWLRLDGSTVHVEARTVAIVWNGKPAILAVVRDLTDRKRAEERLRHSEERYRRLVELSPDAIHVDCHGRIAFVNSAAVRLFGVRSPEDLIGRTMAEYMLPEDNDAFRALLDMAADGRSTPPVEQRRKRLDGSLFWATVTAIPMTWKGRPATLLVTRDITEAKMARHDLQAAKEAAEFANRSKTEFLANISHELRTPLNAVIGFSDIMMNEMFGPIGAEAYREYARDINDSGSHLLGLINDILDLSKVEAGKLTPNLETVEATAAIAASVRLIAGRADEGGIEIVTAIADDIPPLRADGRMIRQILVNLLSNAVKFTPSGGRVEIEATIEDGGTLVIRVGDNGIGIARKDIATVMAPFGQVDSAMSRVHQGTGLGLPLSRLLSQVLGGDMVIDSAVGVGTTVTVRLPVAGPPAEAGDPVDQVAISAR